MITVSIYDEDPEPGLPRGYGAWETPVSAPARKAERPVSGAADLMSRYPGMTREQAQTLLTEADLYYQAGAPETLGVFLREVRDVLTRALESAQRCRVIRQDDDTYEVTVEAGEPELEP